MTDKKPYSIGDYIKAQKEREEKRKSTQPTVDDLKRLGEFYIGQIKKERKCQASD